jgi:hypothetical protein
MTGPYIGSFGVMGYAKEATLGTPVAAALYVPFSDTSLEKDPGLVEVKTARAQRELTTYVVPGEQKITGGLSFPLFSIMGMALVVGGIGYDRAVTGVAFAAPISTTLSSDGTTSDDHIHTVAGFTAGQVIKIGTTVDPEYFVVETSTGPTPFTIDLVGTLAHDHASGVAVVSGDVLNAAVLAAATTIYTIGAWTPGQIMQIGTGATAECRAVATCSAGPGPYTVTFTTALLYGHAQYDPVVRVVAPFMHDIQQQNALPSFTLESNLGGLESIQYAGCVVNKLTIKGTTKTEAQVTVDLICKADAQITPTVPSYSADQPFVLAGTTLDVFGSSDTAIESFELTVDNMVDPRYTYSGNRVPTYLPSKGRAVELKVTESLQAMTYYGDLPSATSTSAPTSGAETVTLVSGSDQVIFAMPQMAIMKLSQPIKVGETIVQDISLKAWLGALASSMTATIISSQNLPY